MSASTDQALWFLSRSTGAVCLVLFSAALVIGLMVRRQVALPGTPRFVLVGWHRNISLLALIFLVIHIVSALADPYVMIGWIASFVPGASPYETWWMGLGAVAVDLFIAIIVTSLLRGRLPSKLWRGLHLLVYAAWPVSVLHGIGSSSDLQSGLQLAGTAVCCVAVVAAVVWRVRVAAVDPVRAERVPREMARAVSR